MTTPSSRPPFDDPTHKLATYLRLCGLASDEAGRRAALPPARASSSDPADDSDAAMAGLLAQIDAWAVGQISADGNESPARRVARARARVFLSGLPAARPDVFLAACPPEWRTALDSAIPPAVPPLEQTSMAPQSLDLGPVSKVADGTWRTFDKWPFLRSAAMWALFLTLLGVAFYLVRF